MTGDVTGDLYMERRREMLKIRRGLQAAAVLAAALIMCAALSTVSADAAEKKIKTYYTGVDIQGTGFTGYTIRYRVKSYYLGRRSTYSKKREVGEIKNSTSQAATKTLSLSRSTSRTYSISLSAVIPKYVLESDVSATIGGSLTFNNTITISAGATVPPHRSRSVYLQYKYSKDRYKYVVQKQIKKMYGKWKDIGKVSVKYNTSTTKVPVLVL